MGEAAVRLQSAHEALARIDALAAGLRDPYLISRVLARREAVASSGIEGTNSTLDELLAIEETEAGEATAATAQVRDYALVLDAFVPRARRAGADIFTVDLVRDLHRAAMRSDPDYKDSPGDLRTNVVWIGGGRDIAYSTFNPPPPAMVSACLARTVDYMRNEGLQQPTRRGWHSHGADGLSTQPAVRRRRGSVGHQSAIWGRAGVAGTRRAGRRPRRSDALD